MSAKNWEKTIINSNNQKSSDFERNKRCGFVSLEKENFKLQNCFIILQITADVEKCVKNSFVI